MTNLTFIRKKEIHPSIMDDLMIREWVLNLYSANVLVATVDCRRLSCTSSVRSYQRIPVYGDVGIAEITLLRGCVNADITIH